MFVDAVGGQSGLARGALLEYLKQQGRLKCGFQFTESGDVGLYVTVAAATSQAGQVAMSVALRVVKTWKVPGVGKKHPAVLWDRHTVGLSSRERAPSFVEELLDTLIEDLSEELQG